MKMVFRGKAITLIQPWASAIAFAGKDVENRTWATRYRGPIAIHAGGKFNREELDRRIRRMVRGRVRIKSLGDWIAHGYQKYGPVDAFEEVPTSCVVAIGMLTACIDKSRSTWFCGPWGFRLEGIVPIEPVPMTGGLGLWDCRFPYIPLVP